MMTSAHSNSGDEPHRYRFRVGFKHKGYLAARTKILGREKGLAASKMTD